MYEELRERVYRANMLLPEYGIAPFTWGNASEIDRKNGVFAIKPSGVPYEELSPEKIVVLDMDGNTVYGSLNPSSDTPTHLVLYKVFPQVGGIVHSHSVNAVAFAQSGKPILPLGTTHADFSHGEIPVTRELSEAEVENEYEKNTGFVIAECFKNNNIDYTAVPAVLVKSHGPFVWGKNAKTAADNAAVLEIIAQMALRTEQTCGGKAEACPLYIQDKHYFRKHGKNAYYGQK